MRDTGNVLQRQKKIFKAQMDGHCYKAIVLAWTMKISFPIKSEHKKEWKEMDSKQRS